MRILNTTFESVIQENGKKKWNVDGPLAVGVLLLPLAWAGAVGFAIGRLSKRR